MLQALSWLLSRLAARGKPREPALTIFAAALTALAGITPAMAASPNFDKPRATMRSPLPPDPQNPQAKPVLSCFYYPHFMVKQVDMGEKGADQLSIVPRVTGQAMPRCLRENAPNEIVIGGSAVSGAEWSGYFEGVKGGYVFFSADDGWNDGMGFAVFTEGGKKIFDDVAKTWHSVSVVPGGLALRYQRVYGASCSLQADRAGCWQQIKQDTGLTGETSPDCRAAYEAEAKRTPDQAQQVMTDPTIVDYEAAVAIDGTTAKISPMTGTALGCRPSE